MKQFITVYRTELLAFLGACAFITLMFMFGRGYAGASPCVGDAANTSTCWNEYYERVIERKGAALALGDLKARAAEGGGAQTFCHPLVHLIGAAAAREYDSLGKAFENGDSFCRAGYYHGVLEGVFGESDTLLQSLDGICADIPGRLRYSYEYFSCVHGIGHGLMAYFDHDLFASLEGCDRLSPEWERHSCYGGVFMENVISNTPEMPSRYLKDDDPLYPCTAVDERYRADCYLMQSSHMLTLFNGDFERTFAACDGVEQAHRRICFESIGRDVSGYSGGSAESAHALCMLGGNDEARERCVVGAAVDFVQSAGVERAEELCGISGVARDACMSAVSIQVRML